MAIQTIPGPTPMWKVCYTQNEAFQMSRSLKRDMNVFSFESESFQDEHGKRLFLVTSYEEFWHYYSQLKQEQRHHYEIIPDGCVCHLYFDLEFLKAANPEANGSSMTCTVMKFVFAMLWREWKIKCDESNVLQLDACTDTKFSKHLIFHLKSAVFKDNVHMGKFISHIFTQLKLYVNKSENELQEEQEEEAIGDSAEKGNMAMTEALQESGLILDDLESLIVKTTDGKDVLFCDTGVYTKNRNFRLYLSSKLRKNNPLVLSEDNKYVPQRVETTNRKSPSQEKLIFMDSLIANVKYSDDLRILTYTDQTPTGSSLNSIPSPLAQTGEDVTSGCNQESPYPEIDRFIGSVINKGGVQGTIRRWLYFAQGHMLLYDILKNRWCENIGRAHKSNNVMILVDLVKCVYYQKCHDPECRRSNYRSNDFPLPTEVTELCIVQAKPDDWPESEDDLSDEQLISFIEDPVDENSPHNISDINMKNCNLDNEIPSKKLKLPEETEALGKENVDMFAKELTDNLSDQDLIEIVEDVEQKK